ncbi:MAG: malto-oligosyltrehalose synthase [Desulfonatronovibrio sp.]
MYPEPLATYRLQLHPGFGFNAASELVSYLAELGISHVYTSPYLQAAAGSTHGYDVVDPTRINTELGGSKGHENFCRALKKTGLAHMLDLVPNHMAILANQNPWWWDVLENGPSSFYAAFFDVDWESSEDRWPNKVLLPVLGDHYGRILEAGELKLIREDNVFKVHYYEHVFPVDLSSLGTLLTSAARSQHSDMLHFIADCCNRLPRPTVTSRREILLRQRDKAIINELLNSYCTEEKLQEAITAEIERINQDPEAMDQLLDQQNYRLAFWRIAGRDLGYRRFFDINELAGLRVENEEVFMTTHALPLKWFQEGKIQGLRVDHPDGLRDPAGYFRRLRKNCPKAWIVAEKILEHGEELPEDWPVQGTTGYDFLNMAGGLFIDPQGEKPLTDFYAGFINENPDYQEVVKNCKHQIISESLGSELNRLTALFVEICEKHRRHRDYTRDDLHEVLLQTAALFPVYRTYVRAVRDRQDDEKNVPIVSETDKLYMRQAIAAVKSQHPELDNELLNFLENILLLNIPGQLEGELAMRFQQFTSPAMAKGVEDTAFYRYHRLICLNEVGGAPDIFGISSDEFHQHGVRIQEKYPQTLLAGTTHDTKRSEDVRARLALLSEIPRQWTGKIKNWFKRNENLRVKGLPEANTEYLIYQTLAGAWPIDAERLENYLEKAMREAKLYTSWTRQDQAYEEAVLGFSRALLEDREFCQDLERFLAPLIPAGRINSLAQTLLRLTFPGVPDIYQGSELWEMSLVDPDNRRPVDFARRQKLLTELTSLNVREIMDRMEEGLPKLWLIRQTMHFRRARPGLFGRQSTYEPLYAQGKKAGHVVSFCRGGSVITVVPRLVLKLNNNWEDTSLELPPGAWSNILTGERFPGGAKELARLLDKFPAALLIKDEKG